MPYTFTLFYELFQQLTSIRIIILSPPSLKQRFHLQQPVVNVALNYLPFSLGIETLSPPRSEHESSRTYGNRHFSALFSSHQIMQGSCKARSIDNESEICPPPLNGRSANKKRREIAFLEGRKCPKGKWNVCLNCTRYVSLRS